MKKLLFTLATLATCVAAFAQGRISFQTDSLHLVYFDQSWGPPLAGQALNSTNGPGGVLPVADLYLGTSSSLLSLISTTTFSANAGKWNTLNVQVPGIPGGTTVFVVAQIRDGSTAPENIWTPGFFLDGPYYGVSQEFTFVLGTSTLAYPPMYAHGAILGGGLSTWADGTYNLDQYGIGFRGAIAIPYIPEPSTIALAGLGATALLILRRNHRTRGPHDSLPMKRPPNFSKGAL